MTSRSDVQPAGSPAATEALGARLGAVLRAGDVVALAGPLGAGKTCFVRGIAAGLGGPPEAVRSPTFVLHHVYPDGRVPLHHVDCYRLGPGAGLDIIDLDYLAEDGIVAVEWAEYADLAGFSPIQVTIEIAAAPDARLITVHQAPQRVLAAWRSASLPEAMAGG